MLILHFAKANRLVSKSSHSDETATSHYPRDLENQISVVNLNLTLKHLEEISKVYVAYCLQMNFFLFPSF